MLLQTHFGTKLTERNSLIIFDEVQMFQQARAAIKYLVGEVDSVMSCGCEKNRKIFLKDVDIYDILKVRRIVI